MANPSKLKIALKRMLLLVAVIVVGFVLYDAYGHHIHAIPCCVASSDVEAWVDGERAKQSASVEVQYDLFDAKLISFDKDAGRLECQATLRAIDLTRNDFIDIEIAYAVSRLAGGAWYEYHVTPPHGVDPPRDNAH